MAAIEIRVHSLVVSWIIYIFCFYKIVDGHSCSHSVPLRHEVVHDVPLGPAHVIKKRSIDQPLRIHLVYDGSVSKLEESKQNLVKNDIIPSAVSYWEDTLQVRHTSGPVRLLRQCHKERVRYREGDPYPYCVDGCHSVTRCGETEVPAEHLEACRVAYLGEGFKVEGYSGAGVENADFILYVSAYSTKRCDIGTTVAYAAYCQLEGALDRPVAGYVNLCPDGISTRAHDIHQMHSTIKHEILHALGFSAGLYAFLRDDQGEPLTPRLRSTGKPVFNETTQLYQWSDSVVRTVTRKDWKVRSGTIEKQVNMIVTPRVVAEVRKHFNCSTLEGAELEDQGVIGTALTHWEKRIFENEGMTGTYTQNPLISRITLALMEDTGWYKVKYENAESLTWGRNLGCDFVQKSCLHWMDRQRAKEVDIHPFCNRIKKGGLQTECTDERDAVALCNLVEYETELPPEYQHFHDLPGVNPLDVSKYAGSVVLADYCPYIQEFNWKKGVKVVRGSRCHLDENNPEVEVNYALETYSNQSKCFEHDMPWMLRKCKIMHSVEHWGSGCYMYQCSKDRGLEIEVDGRLYPCYHSGHLLSVKIVKDGWLHEGTIKCPPCSEVCQPKGVTCPPEMNPPARLEEVHMKPPCDQAAVYHMSVTMTMLMSVMSVLV